MSQITDNEIQDRIEALKSGVKLTPEEIAAHTTSMVGFNYTVDDYYEVGREKVREFAAKRDEVMAVMRSIPGLDCPKPQGAFYVFPDVSGALGREIRGKKVTTSTELATVILEEAEVAEVH